MTPGEDISPTPQEKTQETWPFVRQKKAMTEFSRQPPPGEICDGRKTVTKAFCPPFTPVDREADYERTWRSFEKRFQ